MKLSKLIILTAMGFVILAVGAYLLVAPQSDEEEIIPPSEPMADLSLEEIHYVETKGDRKEWELKAKAAHHFLQQDLTEVKALTVTFFTDGDRIITVRGDEGSIKGKKEIAVHGNVLITSTDGYRVITSSLHYDAEKRQIYTGDPVLIERRAMRMRGVGIVVDLRNEKLYIHKQVETVIEG